MTNNFRNFIAALTECCERTNQTITLSKTAVVLNRRDGETARMTYALICACREAGLDFHWHDGKVFIIRAIKARKQYTRLEDFEVARVFQACLDGQKVTCTAARHDVVPGTVYNIRNRKTHKDFLAEEFPQHV